MSESDFETYLSSLDRKELIRLLRQFGFTGTASMPDAEIRKSIIFARRRMFRDKERLGIA